MPSSRLFAISTTAEVAELLKVSPGEVNHLPSRLDRQYFRRPRRKPDGTKRVLFVPSDPLKLLQRKVYDHILSKVPLLACVLGGVKGRSPIENAAMHTNSPCCSRWTSRSAFRALAREESVAIFQSLGFGPGRLPACPAFPCL